MNNVVNQVAFLRTSRQFPEELHQLTLEVNKSYVDIANAVNNRTISIFPTNQPAITGENWFITNQRQQTFRQVYVFGAISPGAELDIPTNILNLVTFTRIYGVVITNVPDYRPLPYISSTVLTNSVNLLVGLVGGIQQIRIIMGATAIPVTSGQVVLEWMSQI